MFLAVDIGNSNIKFGIFDGPALVATDRIRTPREMHNADPAALLREKLNFPVAASLICSVVPEVNDLVLQAIAERFGITGRIVRNDDDFGLDVRYAPLADAGTDRIVGSFAAAELFGAPCVTASFGTALTVDAVNADRVLLGGIIAPGPRVMASALASNTSRLPDVDLTSLPARAIQTATKEAIQSGILRGYLGMAERLIESVRAECDPAARVVATGGYARFASENLDIVETIEPELVLRSLRLCYDRWDK